MQSEISNLRSQISNSKSRAAIPVSFKTALVAWLLVSLASGITRADGAWKQALPGFVFEFPRDHGSHPAYKIEWWYYTGNLSSGSKRFGYQLTFFRIGVDSQPKNPSRWAVRDLFMTHWAITDLNSKQYRYFERMNRAGASWAGADTARYRVWNRGWEARLDLDGTHQLKAAESGVALALALSEGKRPVIHGERGISQKGNEAGNASHYYSLTRMPTRGTCEPALANETAPCSSLPATSWETPHASASGPVSSTGISDSGSRVNPAAACVARISGSSRLLT